MMLTNIRSSVSKVFCKVKSSKIGRALSVALVTAMIACMTCVTCFAEGGEQAGAQVNMASTLQTALQTTLNDFMSYAAVVLPIALVIFGLRLAIIWATKLFKRLSN